MFTRESSVPIDRPLLLLPHDFLQARGENNRIVKTNPEHREDRHERWAVSSGQRKKTEVLTRLSMPSARSLNKCSPGQGSTGILT